MNNMYEILGKMNLLEGRGSKPDFLDLDKDGNKKESMKKAAGEVDESTRDYSAKKARAGKDIGKPGKAFATIAAKAGKAYGSAERGEKVAGAVLKKLRAKESIEESDMDESALQAYLGKKKYGETGMRALQKAGREGASKETMARIRAKHDKMDEADMEEGNKFTGNLAKARAAGLKKADLDGDGDMETVREESLDELDMRLLKGLQGAMTKNQKDPESERNIHKKYGYRTNRDETTDDDYDEHGNLKDKKKGRPKGSGRKLGAKGPTGRSKLLRMKEDETQLVDRGEYDREGDMAKEQLHTIEAAAKELHRILSDDQNLPEWVQSKITKAMDYIDTARDYMASQKVEKDEEGMMPERKLSKPEMAKREKFVKSMKKSKGDFEKRYGERGEEVMYATATKMAKKKGKEETEESTVAGSVASAPTGSKGKKGMVFGKGVYEGQILESFDNKLKTVLSEGMSINMSMGENGKKSLSVNATDEDAIKLAQILKLAGMGSGAGYKEACPACGQQDCGCEQMEEDAIKLAQILKLAGMGSGAGHKEACPACGQQDCCCEQMEEDAANAPKPEMQSTDYMTKTIAGGLNKNKVTGMTTIPVVPTQQVSESEMESNLMSLYKQYKSS
jgi:ribosome-associated protein YbcJ (S4-like RNA binding protein)